MGSKRIRGVSVATGFEISKYSLSCSLKGDLASASPKFLLLCSLALHRAGKLLIDHHALEVPDLTSDPALLRQRTARGMTAKTLQKEDLAPAHIFLLQLLSYSVP